jgi:hypothetical protein
MKSKRKRSADSQQRMVSLPRTIPRKHWWKCTCHGKLQKYKYAFIVGKHKLCSTGSAKFLWDGKLPRRQANGKPSDGANNLGGSNAH